MMRSKAKWQFKGATRWVFIVGRYAVKIPSLHNWRCFLNGLLGNMQETQFSKTGHEKLCPVLFSIWGGWLVIMPFCPKLIDAHYSVISRNFSSWIDVGEMVLPVENKYNSFGYYKGMVVAVDYG